MGYDGDRFVWENRRVRSEQVCFGEVQYEPGGSCGPRVQRDYQLVFLHSGSLDVRVAGEPRRLAPGEVGLFLPGKSEDFRFSEALATHHSWCAIAPGLVPSSLRHVLEQTRERQPCSGVQSRLLAAGLTIGRVDSDLSGQVVDHLGLALLAAYAHDAAEGSDVGVVAKATRYIEEHLFDPDCLQQAHLSAKVSRNTLISHFRKDLGTTPARYVWHRRTERGIAMLFETGHTIAEIAYRCGFRDPFHFSRLVKAMQGVAPLHLREQMWSNAGRSQKAEPKQPPAAKRARSRRRTQ